MQIRTATSRACNLLARRRELSLSIDILLPRREQWLQTACDVGSLSDQVVPLRDVCS